MPTVKQLKAICREKGIRGYSRKRKAQIEQMIKDHDDQEKEENEEKKQTETIVFCEIEDTWRERILKEIQTDQLKIQIEDNKINNLLLILKNYNSFITGYAKLYNCRLNKDVESIIRNYLRTTVQDSLVQRVNRQISESPEDIWWDIHDYSYGIISSHSIKEKHKNALYNRRMSEFWYWISPDERDSTILRICDQCNNFITIENYHGININSELRQKRFKQHQLCYCPENRF